MKGAFASENLVLSVRKSFLLFVAKDVRCGCQSVFAVANAHFAETIYYNGDSGIKLWEQRPMTAEKDVFSHSVVGFPLQITRLTLLTSSPIMPFHVPLTGDFMP